MRIRVYGEVVELTDETIEKTWEYHILQTIGCITEVLFKGVRVNDTVDYINWRLSQLKDLEARTTPISLGFIQTAYYIQTGESVPILSK